MSNIFDRITEQKIQEAIQNGEFDHLPGAGQPLNLEKNPYASPESGLAFDILKNNGLSPAWNEKRKEFEADLLHAQNDFLHAHKYHADQACREFLSQVESINRKIFDYNLSVPHVSMQRSLIDPHKMMTEILRDR